MKLLIEAIPEICEFIGIISCLFVVVCNNGEIWTK